MANPNPPPPPEHSRWKPGQSGNPGGRKPMPENVKKFKRMSQTLVMEMLAEFSGMTETAVKELAKHPDTPALKKIFAQMFLKGMKSPDTQVGGFILDRMVGKVKDELTINDDRDADLETIPRDRLIAIASEG